MKYIYQLLVILGVSFAGEVLSFLLPFPIPASVYGLVLLFLLLCTKVIKLEQVEGTASYLIAVMPVFFIEPSIGLMTSFGAIRGKVLPLVIAAFVSTAAVMAVTSLSAQAMIRRRQKKEGRRNGPQ